MTPLLSDSSQQTNSIRIRSMNRSHLLSGIIFLCLSSLIFAQSVEFNGLWLGYERFKYKGDTWFYQNRLSIKDGVVRLVKSPETHDGKEVVYSASEGGFPTFRGRLVVRGRVTVAVIAIESCDYCFDAADSAVAEGKKAWHVPIHGVVP